MSADHLSIAPRPRLPWVAMAIALWLLLETSPATAQTGPQATAPVTSSDATNDVDARIRTLLDVAAENRAAIAPPAPKDAQRFDEETEQAFQLAWQAYYGYLTEGYAFRQKVFNWQDRSTKIIFAVVILLVLLGMYFAAIQFHSGRIERMTNGQKDTEGRESLESTVEFSWKSVKVRSPVLGVVILVISIAFFYLYLVYVYPITNAL